MLYQKILMADPAEEGEFNDAPLTSKKQQFLMKFDNTFSECINECKYKARVQNCPGIPISTFQISPGQCYGQGQGQGQGG